MSVCEKEELASGRPSVIFTNALTSQINKEDVTAMVQLQKDMLSRYEKSNEMLINFNLLSSARFETTFQEFKRHTCLLYEMKKDLDVVFKRIRSLKQRLSKMYPEAFAACSDVYNVLDVPEDSEALACSDDVDVDKLKEKVKN